MWHCQQKAAMPQKYIDKSRIATYNSGIATKHRKKGVHEHGGKEKQDDRGNGREASENGQ